MASLIELNKQGEILRRDLEAIEGDLLKANTALQHAVSNPNMDEAAAGAMAGRVALLQARKIATEKAIEAKDAERATTEAFVNSKEYKQAEKRIAELEAIFAKEATESRKAVSALRDRVLKALQLQSEYKALRQQLGEPQQAPPTDVLNLLTTFRALEGEVNRYQSIDTAEARTRALIAARRNPKPAPQVQASKPGNFWHSRYSNSDGTPIVS